MVSLSLVGWVVSLSLVSLSFVIWPFREELWGTRPGGELIGGEEEEFEEMGDLDTDRERERDDESDLEEDLEVDLDHDL